MRFSLVTACSLLGVAVLAAAGESEGELARPSPEQLAWQDLEYGMFVHFGVNTFHNVESSDGSLSPESFLPADLDADQWVRTAKEVGMKYLVVTAKHRDGFCLFRSKHTDYGVMSSPWREGKGDVVKDVADACARHGIRLGIYLSPWDQHCPFYGDEARYDDYYKKQLTELLTGYGPVVAVWFDGAGDRDRRYDWAGYRDVVRRLQPKALIAVAGIPDIRWVGNEKGLAPDPCWSFVEQDGKQLWRPAECDVPLRDTRFWHANTQASIKVLTDLVDIYHRSVGHGANLLLNVAPDRQGSLPDPDVQRLKDLWLVLSDMMKTDFARGRKAVSTDFVKGGEPELAFDGDPGTAWQTPEATRGTALEVDLGDFQRFNRAITIENIALGQRIRRYAIEYRSGNRWEKLAEGTAIGHKKIDVFEPIMARRVRIHITEAVAAPSLRSFGLYYSDFPYRKER